MPFIGNQPALSYTSFAKQDFTTSATTSYTLDNPVANANELALFINFVRQEPTTAYSASGTSLTLTSATSASDDMYCVFLGKAVQTVNPPNSSVDSSKINYPLTTFSSTGIDDNATSTAVTIDSSGRLMLGRTSPLSNEQVNFESTDPVLGIYRADTNTSNSILKGYSDVGSTKKLHILIYTDGDIQNTNNTYGAISDRQLKENETDANSQWNDIQALQIKNYNLKILPDIKHLGVIAQDLEASGMNGLVKTNEDGIKSVKYSILYMKSIKALQEAMERIETLEAKVTQLENA